MEAADHPIVRLLIEKFPGTDFAPAPLLQKENGADAQICVRVEPRNLLEVMRFLYENERCAFEQMCDLTCVDYLNFPKAADRYGVTYSLLSISKGHRLWVKCFANDPAPEVPSVTSIWNGADWLEREVWDMFGVKFTGHPDLRRILTWETFGSHPLRKDYPLQGRGEREDFERLTRESS